MKLDGVGNFSSPHDIRECVCGGCRGGYNLLICTVIILASLACFRLLPKFMLSVLFKSHSHSSVAAGPADN